MGYFKLKIGGEDDCDLSNSALIYELDDEIVVVDDIYYMTE